MTIKERWTVYPLLLLAIGLALRGELVDQPRIEEGVFTAKAVVCEELAILGPQPDPEKVAPIIVHAGRVKDGDGGRIEIRDSAGTTSIAIGTTAVSRDGAVEFYDEKNKAVLVITPTGEFLTSPPDSE